MGTIYIEEYGSVGSDANRNAPVSDLKTLLALTKDATTSTTAESVTLGINTRQITVQAVEAHRVCLETDTTATLYAFIPAGERRDFGVPKGAVLYYELDA